MNPLCRVSGHTAEESSVCRTAKYIGSFAVESDSHHVRIEFVRIKLEGMRKITRSKTISLIFSLGGVKVCTESLETVYMAHSLRRISYATCDPEYCQFSFLAREPNRQSHVQYCHAFITINPAEAEELNTIIGEAFKLAFLKQQNPWLDMPLFSIHMKTFLTHIALSKQENDPKSSVDDLSARFERVATPCDRVVAAVRKRSEDESLNCTETSSGVNSKSSTISRLKDGSKQKKRLSGSPVVALKEKLDSEATKGVIAVQTSTPVVSSCRHSQESSSLCVESCFSITESSSYNSGQLDVATSICSPRDSENACIPTNAIGAPTNKANISLSVLSEIPVPPVRLCSIGISSSNARDDSNQDSDSGVIVENHHDHVNSSQSSQYDSVDSGSHDKCARSAATSGDVVVGSVTSAVASTAAAASTSDVHSMAVSNCYSIAEQNDANLSFVRLQNISQMKPSSSGSGGGEHAEMNGVTAVFGSSPLSRAANRHSSPMRHTRACVSSDSVRPINAPWYQPNMPRDQALSFLENKPEGTFLIRDSISYVGCFALSVKVSPNHSQVPVGSTITHYLIHRTDSGGVSMKGLHKQWPCLESMVIHLAVMPEMLPCALKLPRSELENPNYSDQDHSSQSSSLEKHRESVNSNTSSSGSNGNGSDRHHHNHHHHHHHQQQQQQQHLHHHHHQQQQQQQQQKQQQQQQQHRAIAEDDYQRLTEFSLLMAQLK